MSNGISIKLDGLEELRDELRRINATAADVVDDAAKETVVAIRARAVKAIQRGPASGEVYPPVRNRRGKPHQASAPGQPPASDTGTLASSVKWERDAGGYVVGTGIEYGLFLEVGTSRMAPRPWLTPSVEAELPSFRDNIIKAIRRLANGR